MMENFWTDLHSGLLGHLALHAPAAALVNLACTSKSVQRALQAAAHPISCKISAYSPENEVALRGCLATALAKLRKGTLIPRLELRRPSPAFLAWLAGQLAGGQVSVGTVVLEASYDEAGAPAVLEALQRLPGLRHLELTLTCGEQVVLSGLSSLHSLSLHSTDQPANVGPYVRVRDLPSLARIDTSGDRLRLCLGRGLPVLEAVICRRTEAGMLDIARQPPALRRVQCPTVTWTTSDPSALTELSFSSRAMALPSAVMTRLQRLECFWGSGDPSPGMLSLAALQQLCVHVCSWESLNKVGCTASPSPM